MLLTVLGCEEGDYLQCLPRTSDSFVHPTCENSLRNLQLFRERGLPGSVGK
jgi:hypothetical protein